MTESPAVLYAAKSTADKKGSIPTQLQDGRDLAERDGLTVVAEFSDEARSAYHGNRGDGLTNAMAEAERLVTVDGSCALIVQHSDRLARGDGATTRHVVEVTLWAMKTGVRILSKQDPDTFPQGDYALLMGAVAGQRNHEDSKRKGAAVRDGLRRRAALGQSRGGPRPYGYQRAYELNEKGERVSRYAVDEAEAKVVRRIFDEFGSGGKTMRDIATALMQERVPTISASTWRQSTVRVILSRRLYLGVVEDADGNEYPGKHQPIIGEDVFERATAVRKSQIRRKGGRRATGLHLLTRGILKCGKCGSTMYPKAAKDVYVCGGRSEYGVDFCDQPTIPREAVDSALMRQLVGRFIDVEETRRQEQERRAITLAMTRRHVADAGQQAARAVARLDRVQRAFQDGIIEPEDYAEQRQKLLAERDAAKAAAEQASAHLEHVQAAEADTDAESDVLVRMAELARIADGLGRATDRDAIRMMVAQLFNAVFYLPAGHEWLGEAFEVVKATGEPTGDGFLIPFCSHAAMLRRDADQPLYWHPKKVAAPLGNPEVISEVEPNTTF